MNAVELCGSVPPYSVCIYNFLSFSVISEE